MPTGPTNEKSKLVTVRIPHEMLDALKQLGDILCRPYQSVMKDAIRKGLPLVKRAGANQKHVRRNVKSYRARHIDKALRELRKSD